MEPHTPPDDLLEAPTKAILSVIFFRIMLMARRAAEADLSQLEEITHQDLGPVRTQLEAIFDPFLLPALPAPAPAPRSYATSAADDGRLPKRGPGRPSKARPADDVPTG